MICHGQNESQLDQVRLGVLKGFEEDAHIKQQLDFHGMVGARKMDIGSKLGELKLMNTYSRKPMCALMKRALLRHQLHSPQPEPR